MLFFLLLMITNWRSSSLTVAHHFHQEKRERKQQNQSSKSVFVRGGKLWLPSSEGFNQTDSASLIFLHHPAFRYLTLQIKQRPQTHKLVPNNICLMIGDKNKTHNLMNEDMQTGNTKTHGLNIHVIFETDTQQPVVLRKQTKRGEKWRENKKRDTWGKKKQTWSTACSFYTHVHKYIRGTFDRL